MRLFMLFLFVFLLTSCGPAENYDRSPDIRGTAIDIISSKQVLVRNEEGKLNVQEIIVTVEQGTIEKDKAYNIWLEGEVLDSQPPRGKAGKVEKINES
ncbi:hypothetical protein [Halobacillus faecis]|uniref:DUF3221 domain-containing protein n=1 Tax=Halobacillus faecis TaxID=360184 RepID=A0A511WNQ7_9BACI|nr:hypothetical protein [Halobacillus faecis]GEN52776.1 hypothetical protein HFA01_10380 [Halobacillus faecis]